MGARQCAGRLLVVLRGQAYEAAVALAALSAGLGAARGAESAAAQRVLPAWAVRPAEALLGAAGLMTLAGMLAVGLALDGVRRAAAGRIEQAGQWLTAGVTCAVGAGALSAGPAGTTTGAVYLALTAAAATRAAMIGHVLAPGRARDGSDPP